MHEDAVDTNVVATADGDGRVQGVAALVTQSAPLHAFIEPGNIAFYAVIESKCFSVVRRCLFSRTFEPIK